jgi:hypothetical protein
LPKLKNLDWRTQSSKTTFCPPLMVTRGDDWGLASTTQALSFPCYMHFFYRFSKSQMGAGSRINAVPLGERQAAVAGCEEEAHAVLLTRQTGHGGQWGGGRCDSAQDATDSRKGLWQGGNLPWICPGHQAGPSSRCWHVLWKNSQAGARGKPVSWLSAIASPLRFERQWPL